MSVTVITVGTLNLTCQRGLGPVGCPFLVTVMWRPSYRKSSTFCCYVACSCGQRAEAKSHA
eukprot:95604-Chlamydomonas_euryale.AAC.1